MQLITTMLELVGLGLVVAGVWAVFWPAGLMTAGVALLVVCGRASGAGDPR